MAKLLLLIRNWIINITMIVCGAYIMYLVPWNRPTEIQHTHTDTVYCPLPTTNYFNYDTLHVNNLSREIDRSKVEHPLIVLAQALWETGNLGCDSCSLDRNNIFGFRKDSTHYLYFGTWQECVYYYARWQRRKGYKSGEDYFEFLRRKWGAKDPDKYVNAIRKKVKEIDAFGMYNEKR